MKSGDTLAVRQPPRQKPYFEIIPGQVAKVILILAVIVVGWIVILS